MNMQVRTESRYPVNCCPGFEVRRPENILHRQDAGGHRGDADKEHRNTPVSGAYFALPMLIRKVVDTASAMVASNWLPMPNNGQMVETFPV